MASATEALVSAQALAKGLRRNLTQASRGWARWPAGTADLATVFAAVDGIEQRFRAALQSGDADAALATCVGELRTVLEWVSYQSANLTTARALTSARRVTAFAQRFGLLDDPSTGISVLGDSESSLIENVRTRNGYMLALAERSPHLGLPAPLVDPQSLVVKPKRPPGKLALIQRIRKSLRENSGGS